MHGRHHHLDWHPSKAEVQRMVAELSPMIHGFAERSEAELRRLDAERARPSALPRGPSARRP
ncbi:MAG: hypothetical protein JO086_14860 [Acidimicrobiia bacterium]|nr:hypothetical protein [Acidimicrobiia bacterium]